MERFIDTEIEPIALPVKLKKTGRFVVAQAKGRSFLTTEIVSEVKNRLRDRQR